MSIDKYVTWGNEKQDARGIEVCTFQSESWIIPIIATWNEAAIRFWWWDENQWQMIERWHHPLTDVMSSWSERVACVASPQRVSLIYKRHLPNTNPSAAQLFVETFEPRVQDGTVVFANNPPIPVPLMRMNYYRTDRYLWVDVDPGSGALFILTMAYEWNSGEQSNRPRLVLFIGRGDLEDDANWRALDIDAGGFQLDAKRVGERLVVVYRRTPYAFSFPASAITETPAGQNRIFRRIDLSTMEPDLYDPLCVAEVDVSALEVTSIQEVFGGGDHPQVHSLSPLYITVDRLASGTLVQEQMLSPDRHSVDTKWHWSHFRTGKELLELRGASVHRGFLFSFDPLLLPRHLDFVPPYRLELFDDRGKPYTYESMTGTRPVYVLTTQTGADMKPDIIDLLVHEADRVEIRRYQLGHSGSTIIPNQIGQTVVDINHEPIRKPDATSHTFQENSQFWPFEITMWNSGNYTATYAIDNTLGGLLTIARDLDAGVYCAYIDNGDRCPRVIFNPGFRITDPPRPDKRLLPEHVPGSGVDGEEWLELDSDSGWVDSQLPGFEFSHLPPIPLQSIGSKLQVTIDQLLSFIISAMPTLNFDDGLDAGELGNVHRELRLAIPAENSQTFENPSDKPNLKVTITPARPPAKAPASYQAKVERLEVATRIGLFQTNQVPFILNVATEFEALLDFPASPIFYSNVLQSPVVGFNHAFARIPVDTTIRFEAYVVNNPTPSPPEFLWTFETGGVATTNAGPVVLRQFSEMGDLRITLKASFFGGTIREVTKTRRISQRPVYEWKVNGTALNETEPKMIHAFTETGETDISVAAKDENGNVLAAADLRIPVFGVPTISISLHEIVDNQERPPTIVGTAPAPGFQFRLDNATVPNAGTWRCIARAAFPNGPTYQAQQDLAVEPALSDFIWDIITKLNDNGYASMDNVSLSYSNYAMDVKSDGSGGFGSVKFNHRSTHPSQFRFLGRVSQGQVDYRMKMDVQSSTVTVTPTFAPLVAVDRISVGLWYGRTFTPAILHRDERAQHPTTGQDLAPAQRETVTETATKPTAPAAALSMKPSGTPRIEVEKIEVVLRALPVLDTPGLLIRVLLFLGLAAFAAAIVTSLVVGPGAGIGVGIGVALIGLVVIVGVAAGRAAATAGLRALIEAKLRDQLTSPSTLNSLNNANLLTYAGEGLAEAVAIKAIKKAIERGLPVAPVSADEEGRSRFRNQFWQTVVVTENKCRLLLRLGE